MVTITDQIKLSLGLPLDIRLSNVYVEGPNMVIESIPEYLLRVDSNSRYLGQEVIILSPSGSYNLNTFVDLINDAEIHRKKYAFYTGLLDENFLEINIDGVTIVDNLIDGGSNYVLSAEQGKVLKQLIDSSTVGLDADVIASTQVGAVNIGDTIPEGIDFSSFVKLLFNKTYYPTFTNPSSALTYTGINSTVECGTISNITFTNNFNRGVILGDLDNGVWNEALVQNHRSGEALNYTINGVDTNLTNTLLINNKEIVLGANTFISIVDYAQGPQPLDSLGSNYSTPLASGNVSSSSVITGYRKAFYGTSTSDIIFTTSNNVRSLSNSLLNPVIGTIFNVNIPIGSKMIVFAYPASLQNVTSVQYVEGLSAEIKGIFTQTLVNVEGANGYLPVSYKVYTYIPASAFTQTATYKVTI